MASKNFGKFLDDDERIEEKGRISMTITNILCMLVVFIAAGGGLFYFLKKKREAPTENVMDVDDKTYTLEKMKEFVKRR